MPDEPFHAYDPAAGRVLTLRVLAPGEGRVPGRIYLEQVAAEPFGTEDEGECCDGCGGDRLPLKTFEARGFGVGPGATAAHRLCEICSASYIVSAWRSGSIMSCEAKDVLIGNHILLAEIRSIARTGE